MSMIDQQLLDHASHFALARGLRLLQGYRLADTDEAHIARLLDYMAPEPGSSWVDIGSGFGEAARLMLELRLDLRFTLVNNNKFQLSQTPEPLQEHTVFADMQAMPFPESRFDGAMFLYSFCHADNPWQALLEASRVVRPGGRLFVYDYMRIAGDNALTVQTLFSRFWYINEWLAFTRFAGWKDVNYDLPDGDDKVWRSLMDGEEGMVLALYERVFSELVPMLWKATRA